MKGLVYIFGLLFMLSFSLEAKAVWQLPIVNFDKGDYKGGTQNWAVARSHNDWLYFANNYGLLEFDGFNWNLYGIWNSSPVRSVTISDDRRIYVGGVGEFGFFDYNSEGELSYNSLAQGILSQVGNIGDIWDIKPCKGSIFLRTRENIVITSMQADEWKFLTFNGLVLACELVDDRLYVVSESGLYVCTLDGDVSLLSDISVLSKYNIRNIKHIGSHRFILSTHFNGLYIYEDGKVSPFHTDVDNYIRHNMLYTIAVSEDNIAIGTVSGGVVVVDKQGNSPMYINMQSGLQNNTVLCLMFDVSGDLWCGLDQGIDKVSVSSPFSYLYSRTASLGSGYAQAIHDNKLFIGTNRGLFVSPYPFDESLQTFSAQSIAGSMGQVWNLQMVSGELFCLHDKGLFRIDDKGLNVLDDTNGFWQIRLLPLNDKYAIVGSYAGLHLMRYEDGHMKLLWQIKNFSHSAKTFEIDSNNRIWIVTEKGIERITLNAAMTEASPEVILPHPGGTVYHNIVKLGESIVVSQGSKSYITNSHNNLSESVGALALLDGCDVFYSNIEEDAEGNIWYIVGDELKVCRFNSQSRKYADKSQLVANISGSIVYGFTHLMPLDNNEVMIGTTDGFIKCNNSLSDASQRAFQPKVFIRDMMVISDKADQHHYVINAMPLSETIEVPYNANSLRFTFGCSQCYEDTELYSYSLSNNGEHTFSPWTNDHTKDFTFLQPGDYEFKVLARTQNGIEAQPSVISFTILPPWYKTWWAYILWFVILVIIVLFFVFIIHKRNELTRRRLIEQNEIKMRQQEQLFAQQALQHDKEILQLQNEKIESELKSKSEELSNILLNNINRNELITKVRHDLKKITDDLNEKDVKSALKRISMMQSRLITDGEQKLNWERFEENFDIVNDKFLNRLQERYPWISDSEKRLCVYIRMGLLNKEMAPLMNITVRGVEMIRYRMRKKMELTRDDDLDALLKEIAG